MTGRLRRQLSLFAPEPMRTQLDALRATLDPVQHRLIPAHVTLCREDELGALGPSDLAALVARQRIPPVTLTFGLAQPFDGHGILLPCIRGDENFHMRRDQLLAQLLPGVAARRSVPHLTLAHPRNPRASGNSLRTAQRLPVPIELTFRDLHLIEQVDAAPWRVLATIPLGEPAAPDT